MVAADAPSGSPLDTVEESINLAKDREIDKDIEKGETPGAVHGQISEPLYSVWSKGAKIWIIFLVSVSALISPFGATTFFPALNVLSKVLDITPTQVNLSVTTYMVAQAISPAFIGTMSDNNGRRLSFIVCFVIFTIGNIGLALQTNYVALLILRMVQAVGCTATIALAFAVVADVATSAERGKYMGYAGAGLIMGPAFGPTIGGLLAQYLGWRSIFWFLAIFSAVLLALFIFLFPETCRNVVGNGSIPAQGINQSVIGWWQQRKLNEASGTGARMQKAKLERRKVGFPNPLATFRIITEKESGIILFYNGLFLTGLMVTVSAIPDLFSKAYHLNELEIGLCYISNGIGALLSSLTTGHLVDWNFRRHAKAMGMTITKGQQQDLSMFPIERVRLQVVIPGHIIGILGLVAFGWTVKFQTHIAGPEIALFVVGFGISTVFTISNGLLLDLHRDQPATATAAVNFVRCLMSAGGR
ncbi:major facilitator superfamily domain-containing protein [Phaeosphaeriaceae sp. PMI808]|nr:major facilitator superfamily domain-containing protein [Phaeosphaeriaceae sp. PMI808]